MKTKLLLILLATSFIWVSCTEKETYEPETPSQDQSKMENMEIFLTATIGVETKSMLAEGDKVMWSPQDRISVFYNSKGSTFISTNSKPVTTASFSGLISVPSDVANEELELYGIYPDSRDNAVSGGVIRTFLASDQIAVEEGIGLSQLRLGMTGTPKQ